jgi:ketosteroid isomerase-like protein
MRKHMIAEEFFRTYTRALLDRDAEAIADLYAVPALIAFPGQVLAVADRAQTAAFFASAFGQYDGVTDARTSIDVVAETGHSIWADVTWSYDGPAAGERNMYQLLRGGDGVWRIGVLTPLSS